MFSTLALTIALAAQPHPLKPSFDGPIRHYLAQTTFHASPIESQIRLTQTGSRDSLKNGAAIGAVVAGVATGLFIGQLCRVFNDSDSSCWPPVLLWTAAGAGAGALIGAGVDALFQRRVIRATVKF